MIAADPVAVDPAVIAEVKAYCRIDDAGEDMVVTRLAAAAIGHGEMFTGQLFLARGVNETVPACRAWQRLSRGPVAAITAVSAGGLPLAAAAYAIDIDAGGDGWVRVPGSGPPPVLTVGYTAGIAANWSALPEPLRQGAIRLASHLYAHRDAADEGVPPAAIAALWRPWRRMRLR